MSASNPFASDDELKALKAFQQSLDLIPDEMKPAYLEAQRRCPEVIDRESHSLKFLRREDLNPWAAAIRAVNYWKYREQLFHEKAFQTLESAMEPQDIEYVRTGYIAQLPSSSDGIANFVMDVSRIENHEKYSSECKDRSSFYVFQMATENVKAQTEGINMIVCISSSYVEYQRTRGWTVQEMYQVAFPLKQKQLFAICTGFSIETIPHEGNQNWKELELLRGDTPEAVLSLLEQHGFKKQDLPPALGGTWSYDNHTKLLMEKGLLNEVFQTDQVQETIKVAAAETTIDPRTVPIEASIGVHLFQELEIALNSINDKEDYLVARQHGLIDTESPLDRFLLCSDYDPKAAAARLVSYWRLRKELFGDRAFLPLNLTSEGAFTDEDLKIIDKGYATILPPDNEGCPVVCFDERIVSASEWQDGNRQKPKIWFYFVQVLAERELAQTKGLVVLYVLSKPDGSEVIDTATFTRSVFVKYKKCHIVCLKPTELANEGGYFDKIVPFALRVVNKALIIALRRQTGVLVAENTSHLANLLGGHGLLESQFPTSLGGELCSKSVFEAWKSDRIRLERKRLGRHADGLPEEPTSKKQRVSPVGAGTKYARNLDTLEDVTAFEGTDSVIDHALEKVEAAISMLPDAIKSALLEARERAPQLVQEEAPVIRFLRVDKYDPWRAAHRLACYWSVRKRIFDDRWLLPMNQSGEGCLSRDDLNCLNSGYQAFLQYDVNGRSVLLFDAARRASEFMGSRAKVMFYMWSIACENEKTQLEGIVGIYIMRPSLQLPSQSREMFREVFDALPLQMHEFHVVNSFEESEQHSILQAFLKPALKMLTFILPNSKFTMHICDTKLQLINELVSAGIIKDSLPECLGGTWSYEEFRHWQELRARYEWGKLLVLVFASFYRVVPSLFSSYRFYRYSVDWKIQQPRASCSATGHQRTKGTKCK
jgi:hypothetical protein